MVNWTEIFGESSTTEVNALVDFANNKLTRKEVVTQVENPEFRRVIRNRGADQTRNLVRKALRRRQMV